MPRRETYRFAEFELDLNAFELRRGAQRIRLERRPKDLLVWMLGRPGELISRDEIVAHIWGTDVFIESESGVNTLVRKLRQALGDAADAPRFIETIPGRGYRFIADVQVVGRPGPAAVPDAAAARATDIAAPVPSGRRSAIPLRGILTMVGLAAAAVAGSYWLRSGAAEIAIAVLPFENISVAPGQEYLADALHDETIAALNHVDPRHLRVKSRATTVKYRKSGRSPAEIGRELGVEYLVEGAIRTENARVRITTSLVRVRDQKQMWSSPFEYEPRVMLEFQRELSAAIAEQISVRLSPSRIEALARRHSRDAEAVDMYLRGQFYWNQLTPSTTQRAIEYFEHATARDSQYALPWAGIAVAYAAAPINADGVPLTLWPRARDAAGRAIHADASLAEAQTALGMVQFWFDWDWPGAEASFLRAVDADPNYALAHRMLGIARSHLGTHPGALAAMRRLRELEPTLAMNHALSAQVAFNARDFTAALDHANQAALLDPAFWIARYQAAQALVQLREYDRALDMLAPVVGANSKALSLQGYAFARSGRIAEARQVLDALSSAPRERYVPPYALALVYAGLGEREAALRWLQQAVEVRDVHLAALRVDPKWDDIREDPRFVATVDRCGFTRARP